MPTRLTFLDGSTESVEQTPEDAARLLWGKKDGDDAHDMGYAALTHSARPGDAFYVNPTTVLHVHEAPEHGRASFN